MPDPWDIVGGRTWPAQFLRGAEAAPGAVAVEDEAGGALTRGELRGRAAAVMAALIDEHGVAPGDRVGLLLDNGLAYTPVVLAVAAAGATAAPISRALTDEEIRVQVAVSGLALVVAEAEASVAGTAPTISVGSLPAEPETDPAALARFDAAVVALGSDDISTIICTSGSTAAPKPIVISHGNIMFAASASWTIYAIGDGDVGLSVFPWAHSNGHINQLLCWLTLGVRLVVADRFTASGFPDQLRRFRPDIAPLNTTHIKMVLAKLPAGVTKVESPLRIVPTALEMDGESAVRFHEVFGARMRKVWYQTETIAPATIVDLVPPHTTVNDNPIGHPGLAHELRLLGEDGNPVEPGEIGELHIRAHTRHSFAVGRIDPETHEVIHYDRDAWWPTGDLAIAEPDGYLFYAGRTKEMVKRSGHNVALAEVNEVIRAHPAVADAVTFGVPDPMREEQIIAAVVFTGDEASTEMLDWCRERLADYKVPSDVVVYEEIPTTELGKIDMQGMKAAYLGEKELA